MEFLVLQFGQANKYISFLLFFQTMLKKQACYSAFTNTFDDQGSIGYKFYSWGLQKSCLRIFAKATLGKPRNLLKHPLALGNSLLKRSNHLAEAPADCAHYLLQTEVGITKSKRVMMVEGNWIFMALIFCVILFAWEQC